MHKVNSEKVKEELRRYTSSFSQKKVSEGRCNFVAVAQEDEAPGIGVSRNII